MDKYTVLDSLFEAACVIDDKNKIIYYNHHFSSLTKASPRVIKSKGALLNIIEFINFDFNQLISNLKRDKGERVSPEIKISTQDQDKKTHKADVVLKANYINSKEFLILFNDISIEKKLYDKYKTQLNELKETHEQIIQADKLSTIGELTANISHEISNPLTIASGNVELIETLFEDIEKNNSINPDDTETLKVSIKDIKESHERINNIIDNLKTFLHKSEGEKEYYDIGQVAQETYQFMSQKLEDSEANIRFKVTDTKALSLINKVKFGQVLVNLYRNAIDAINEKVHRQNIKDHEIHLNVGRDDKKNIVFFEITDTGQGISEEFQSKMFTPFHTTKEVGEGTGLGLSISQKIMQAHKGNLYLLKSSKDGTTIRGELPSIEVISFTENEIKHNPKQESSYKRILVVDDEPQVINILNEIISKEGMIFVGSAKAQDALKMFDEVPIDSIIVDYHMPEINGKEFSRSIREKNSTCEIFYMSSPDNKDKYIKDKDELKLSGFIEKPFNSAEIKKILKRSSS